jgi:hypothetical protein
MESTNRTLVRSDKASAAPRLRLGNRKEAVKYNHRLYVIRKARMATVGSARMSMPAIRAIRKPLRVEPACRVLRPFVDYPPIWTRSGPV